MRAALLVLALALAGCGAPDAQTAQPATSCAARFAGPPGANAALLITLQDDPEVVAQRFADALGLPLRGPPRVDAGGGMRWDAGNATLEYDRPAEHVVRLALASPEPLADGEAALEALRASFQLPADVAARTREDGARVLAQTYAGVTVEGADAILVESEGATIAFGPFYEIAPGVEAKPDAELAQIARERVACALAENGDGGAPGEATARAYAVREASLVRVFSVKVPQSDAACGDTMSVQVDAATGAVHDFSSVQCA